jgi:acetoin utilization deacetylase AcuC-like enzyme
MLLYHSQDFEGHETGAHPECTERITRVNEMLDKSGWLKSCQLPEWQLATPDQCLRIHTEPYLTKLEKWCKDNAGRIEADTVVSTRSWNAALRGAGAACDAVERVLRGEDTKAFCAIRPPGHHAVPDNAMGFCLLNNVAIAARHARSLGLERVLIVDWDIHHGNGTQDAFWEDPTVAFVSIHRFPFYPGTGRADEKGGGAAFGTKKNIPVHASTTAKDFLAQLMDATDALAARFKPQLLLLSAGFDAHRADPVGGLSLEESDFETAGRWIGELAATHCDGRLVSLLEGGYNLTHMPQSVDAHLRGLQSH